MRTGYGYRQIGAVFAAACLAGLSFAQPPRPELSPIPPRAAADEESPVRKADAAAQSLAAKIDQELATMDRTALPDGDWAKEWAGAYYTGDGLGMNVTIKVAPKAGVSYRWRGCMGTYGARTGTIETVLADGLKIKFSQGPDADEMRYMTEVVHFVRWGDRRYLVPSDKLGDFVHNFREGGFARSGMFGIPRKDGHNSMGSWREATPEGLPELPAEFMKQLRYKEVVLKFKSIQEVEPAQRDKDSAVFAVTLDGGSNIGVSANDMLTYRQGRAHGIVDIESIRDQSCSGHLIFFRDEEPELKDPVVGATLKFLSPLPEPPAAEAAPARRKKQLPSD